MKPGNGALVIRFIKFILDLLWIAAIVISMAAVIGLPILSNRIGALFYSVIQHYPSSLVVTSGVKLWVGFQPDYTLLFIGLVLLAVAELFRHGVELEEEKALTI